MRPCVTAWVALGANWGDALAQVQRAVTTLQQHPELHGVEVSRLYRTAPHQAQGPDFINAVVRLQTPLTAPALLDVLHDLEQQAGRERPYPNAPRTLDLDLIFYGDACILSPRLTVPHPRWRERAFVLYPLLDLSPDKVPPACLEAVANQPITPLP
jgi:2-amino-4-hydroxy-6-hydroxymethyldihydropteridine diphosphokinase